MPTSTSALTPTIPAAPEISAKIGNFAKSLNLYSYSLISEHYPHTPPPNYCHSPPKSTLFLLAGECFFGGLPRLLSEQGASASVARLFAADGQLEFKGMNDAPTKN